MSIDSRRTNFTLQPSRYDLFERSFLEDRMPLKNWILFVGDKLDELGWILTRALDGVSLPAAPTVDAVSMIAPAVHARGLDAETNAPIGAFLFRYSRFLNREADAVPGLLCAHRGALDALPFHPGESQYVDDLGHASGAQFGKVAVSLIGSEDLREQEAASRLPASALFVQF